MYVLKLKMCEVVDGINEAENEVGAGQADDEIVAGLSQLRVSHHGPNKHVNSVKNSRKTREHMV